MIISSHSPKIAILLFRIILFFPVGISLAILLINDTVDRG